MILKQTSYIQLLIYFMPTFYIKYHTIKYNNEIIQMISKMLNMKAGLSTLKTFIHLKNSHLFWGLKSEVKVKFRHQHSRWKLQTWAVEESGLNRTEWSCLHVSADGTVLGALGGGLNSLSLWCDFIKSVFLRGGRVTNCLYRVKKAAAGHRSHCIPQCYSSVWTH